MIVHTRFELQKSERRWLVDEGLGRTKNIDNKLKRNMLPLRRRRRLLPSAFSLPIPSLFASCQNKIKRWQFLSRQWESRKARSGKWQAVGGGCARALLETCGSWASNSAKLFGCARAVGGGFRFAFFFSSLLPFTLPLLLPKI